MIGPGNVAAWNVCEYTIETGHLSLGWGRAPMENWLGPGDYLPKSRNSPGFFSLTALIGTLFRKNFSGRHWERKKSLTDPDEICYDGGR